jgi:hypothetical protein
MKSHKTFAFKYEEERYYYNKDSIQCSEFKRPSEKRGRLELVACFHSSTAAALV